MAFPVQTKKLAVHRGSEGSMSSAAQNWSSVDSGEEDCYAKRR